MTPALKRSYMMDKAKQKHMWDWSKLDHTLPAFTNMKDYKSLVDTKLKQPVVVMVESELQAVTREAPLKTTLTKWGEQAFSNPELASSGDVQAPITGKMGKHQLDALLDDIMKPAVMNKAITPFLFEPVVCILVWVCICVHARMLGRYFRQLGKVKQS